jgi:hypothetical protein
MMFNSDPSEPELLKTVLQPLLDDFRYWFGRSRTLLENETISFLNLQQQTDLLGRVCQAEEAVRTTQTLIQVTNGKVGVDTQVLMSWHQLVTECWQIAIRFRLEQSAK